MGGAGLLYSGLGKCYVSFRINMSTCREMKLDFMSDDSAYIIHNVELRLEVNKVLCVFEFKLL
jgi:hypothetical protein